MDKPYWLKQTAAQPLFPQLAWSRPENRLTAGKLLIIGGSAHGFAAPAEAFAESMRAGIGASHALLPDAIRKIVGILIEQATFAPSTPSGSFSKRALAQALEESNWADASLLAGDFGRNAETAIFLESFLAKNPHPITITKDAADYATSLSGSILHRPHTLLVLSLAQLQRLGTASGTTEAIRYGMGLLQLVDWLHTFTTQFTPHIIVQHLDTLFVAVDGQVTTTKHTAAAPRWRLRTATHASVWWLQNPSKPFEAITASLVD